MMYNNSEDRLKPILGRVVVARAFIPDLGGSSRWISMFNASLSSRTAQATQTISKNKNKQKSQNTDYITSFN